MASATAPMMGLPAATNLPTPTPTQPDSVKRHQPSYIWDNGANGAMPYE